LEDRAAATRDKKNKKKKEPKKNKKKKKNGGGRVYTMPLTPNEPLPPPPFFKIMIPFTNIWQLLLDNGASPRKEEGTRRYWLTLSDQQQALAFNSISRKLSERAFVHYDPIRAIKENSWQVKQPQPVFLRGDESGDIVQVRYNGAYKLCTRETMELFNLEWVRDW
jgi:hypothetical protein